VSADQPPAIRSDLTGEEQNRAMALASYIRGDLPGALHFWRAQHDQPKSLLQVTLVAESLAAAGDSAAISYIEKLAAVRPSDAEAIRAQLYWKQGRAKEAADSLLRFFQAAREDPWPDPGLINRAFALTETVAKSDNSKVMAHALYDSLSKPLCVWNNEAERVVRLLAIALHLDGKNLGQYTASVIQTFEPNVMWERAFLEARKTSYEAVHSPLAAKAARELDEFIDNEALTTDVPSLTREIEKGIGEKRNEDIAH
jgi:hypothetical protein